MTTLSLRARRLQQATKDSDRLERQRDEALDKLTRISARLKAARKTVERYERLTEAKPAAAPMPEAELPRGEPLSRDMIEQVTKAIGHRPTNPIADDELEIPGF